MTQLMSRPKQGANGRGTRHASPREVGKRRSTLPTRQPSSKAPSPHWPLARLGAVLDAMGEAFKHLARTLDPRIAPHRTAASTRPIGERFAAPRMPVNLSRPAAAPHLVAAETSSPTAPDGVLVESSCDTDQDEKPTVDWANYEFVGSLAELPAAYLPEWFFAPAPGDTRRLN